MRVNSFGIFEGGEKKSLAKARSFFKRDTVISTETFLSQSLSGHPFLAFIAGAFLGLAVLSIIYFVVTSGMDFLGNFLFGKYRTSFCRRFLGFGPTYSEHSFAFSHGAYESGCYDSGAFDSDAFDSESDNSEESESFSYHEESYSREEKKSAPPPKQTPSPFVVLGVSPLSSKEKIKKAYRGALKLYHPDKYQSLPPRLKDSSTEITEALNDAYSELKSTGRAD